LQATLKKKKKSEGCPSNQVLAAAMTSASDEKWWPLNCFFSRVVLRTYQHPCMCMCNTFPLLKEAWFSKPLPQVSLNTADLCTRQKLN